MSIRVGIHPLPGTKPTSRTYEASECIPYSYPTIELEPGTTVALCHLPPAEQLVYLTMLGHEISDAIETVIAEHFTPERCTHCDAKRGDRHRSFCSIGKAEREPYMGPVEVIEDKPAEVTP